MGKKITPKLAAVFTPKDRPTPRLTTEECERERESWKISRHEVAHRVHALRDELESYRDQIDAVPFDILADSIPRALDHSSRRWAVTMMEEFNPLIRGLFKRCDEIGQRGVGDDAVDFNADLFELQMHLSETAFGIGLLAGALFAGLPKEQVDRFERGLLYAMQMNPQIVKER